MVPNSSSRRQSHRHRPDRVIDVFAGIHWAAHRSEVCPVFSRTYDDRCTVLIPFTILEIKRLLDITLVN